MLPDLVVDSLRRYTSRKAALLQWFTTIANGRKDLSIPSKPSVEELVTLARRVVQATNPSIPVPASILKSLSETIDLRKRCNAWYEEQGMTDLALRESNRTHRHFLTKLEDILDILTQEYVQESQILVAQNEEDQDMHSQNFFDAVDVESLDSINEPDSIDPEQRSTSQPPAEVVLPSIIPQPALSYEMEDSDGGLQFAVFCLQIDLHAIRQFLSERLSRFRDGEISLVRVSIVINAAIGFARRLEKDFLEAFPSFASWEQVMEATLPDVAHIGKAPFEELEPSKMESLENSLFLPFHQLKWFRDSGNQHNELPKYLLGAVPFMNRGDGLSVQERWRYDSIILNELFREVVSLRYDEPLPVHDELVQGLQKTLKTQNVHLWVVFGLQLFLDTQRILGNSPIDCFFVLAVLTSNLGKVVTRGFRELGSTGTLFKKLYERHIILVQVERKEKLSEPEKETLRHDVRLVNKWIFEDEFKTARQRMKRPMGRPFFFLLHNPVTCGLFQSALLLKLQQKGMENANSKQHILAVAHLYCAAKNERLLSDLWPDMEEIISLGSKDLFLGQLARNLKQYLSSYLTVRGCSMQMFAKGRPNKEVTLSNREKRKLKSSKLMNLFETLLSRKDPSNSDITIGYIETLLHRIARSKETQSHKAWDLGGQWGTSKPLDPVQLLTLLDECVAAEEPRLTFNDAALNEQCFLLLATIEIAMEGMFASWLEVSLGPLGPDFNKSHCLHSMPMLVFLQKPDDTMLLLKLVGQTMGDFIRKRCKMPNERTDGVVSDGGWEGLGDEHPLHNGDCLHWGVCGKDKTEAEQPDQTPVPVGPSRILSSTMGSCINITKSNIHGTQK